MFTGTAIRQSDLDDELVTIDGPDPDARSPEINIPSKLEGFSFRNSTNTVALIRDQYYKTIFAVIEVP